MICGDRFFLLAPVLNPKKKINYLTKSLQVGDCSTAKAGSVFAPKGVVSQHTAT